LGASDLQPCYQIAPPQTILLSAHSSCPAPPALPKTPPLPTNPKPQTDPVALDKAIKWTWITGGLLTLVLVILWPLLALPAGVFSKAYFTMWIIIALIWGFAAMITCLVMPWYESRRHVGKIVKGIFSGEAFKKRPERVEVGMSPMTKG
jgi:hypothetical protein